MRRLIVILVVLSLALVAAGCGSKSSSSSSSSQSTTATTASTGKTHLAKTKFVVHAGLAFGAFHRYIYKPFKEGKFSGGLTHHKLAVVKAAAAAAFAYHETKLALKDARSSKVLSKALAPLLALQTKLGSLRDGLKHGKADTSTIDAANGDTTAVNAAGSQAGQPVHDLPTPQLGH
ncbi:MAG: hypothetical protein JOZ25_06735 [Actinobacteria bacterium]|nr:hypothetical protein [Actinomycetota bacterium]